MAGLIGIMDGCVAVYDVRTARPLGSALETKNCHLFCVHEASKQLCAVTKKKRLLTFSWQAGSSASPLILRQDYPLQELPVCMASTADTVVMGFKKHYVIFWSWRRD